MDPYHVDERLFQTYKGKSKQGLLGVFLKAGFVTVLSWDLRVSSPPETTHESLLPCSKGSMSAS